MFERLRRARAANGSARHLAETTRCYALFATHYFELTQLAAQLPNIANVHLDAVEHKDRIVFLHRLEAGPADRSYGIHVAHPAGIGREMPAGQCAVEQASHQRRRIGELCENKDGAFAS